MSKRLIAELSMPGVASWNGRWSGERDKYTVVFGNNNNKTKEFIGSYHYRWDDGWMAKVTIREAYPREKVTNKFCGYEWMVSEIKQYKEIRCE
jgi:hypothetical protein